MSTKTKETTPPKIVPMSGEGWTLHNAVPGFVKLEIREYGSDVDINIIWSEEKFVQWVTEVTAIIEDGDSIGIAAQDALGGLKSFMRLEVSFDLAGRYEGLDQALKTMADQIRSR